LAESDSFVGVVLAMHSDGRHVFVEFEPPLKAAGKEYEIGWYDLAKSNAKERRELKEGAYVKGKAHVNGSNLAVVESMTRK
jgi:hypothetical protein